MRSGLGPGGGQRTLHTGSLTIVGGPLTVRGDLDVYGRMRAAQLSTPGAPTATPTGVTGATTYTYRVVTTVGTRVTDAGAEGTTTTGNATLDASNFNRLTWTQVTNATGYRIFRTVGGATQGLIFTAPTGLTLTVDDTGLSGDSSSFPTVNTTGALVVEGTADITLNTTVQGQIISDITNQEALLVRRNSDAADIFIVDTTDGEVQFGTGLATPGDAIVIDSPDLSGAGNQSSHNIRQTGHAFDSSNHQVDWVQFVNVSANSGTSQWFLRSRIDGAGFANRFQVTDAGIGSLDELVLGAYGVAPTGAAKLFIRDSEQVVFAAGPSVFDVESLTLANFFATGPEFGFQTSLRFGTVTDYDNASFAERMRIASGNPTVDVSGNVFIDGAADAIQLLVQGHSTQTNPLAVFEQSDGTDRLTLSNTGVLEIISSLGSDFNPVITDAIQIITSTATQAKLAFRISTNISTLIADSSGNFSVAAGTGNLALKGVTQIGFRTGGVGTLGTERWLMTDAGSGNLRPITTNVVDLGTTAIRVRSGFFGTSLDVGLSVAAPGDALIIDSPDQVGDGTQDSHFFRQTGHSRNGGADIQADWRQFVDVTTNAGASTLTFQTRIDAGGYVAQFTVSDAGQLTAPVAGSGAGLLLGGDAQWYRSAADVMRTPDALTVDGVMIVSGATLDIANDSGALRLGAAQDAILIRDDANILALRNGTAQQDFRIYNTFTDASNFERLEFDWVFITNIMTIQTTAGGTGTGRPLHIGTQGSADLTFRTNNQSRWHILSDGNMIAFSDNNFDIGSSGANRPRSIYIGTFIVHGVTAGITASTTQSQGQGALTREVNEVATVVNANDTVTMPTAEAGLKVTVINNGAQTLQIFPASADDLGSGVDTAITLASGSNLVVVAYDATNWETV